MRLRFQCRFRFQTSGVTHQSHSFRTKQFTTRSSPNVEGTIPSHGKGVSVGQFAELKRIYSCDDVVAFGKIISDQNILHSPMNWNEVLEAMPYMEAHNSSKLIQLQEDGETTKPVVHGMFVSSLFSSIFAKLAPGCVYMNQDLTFAAPVHVDEEVVGRVEIQKIRRWRKGGVVLQCDTQVTLLSSQTTAIRGVANVWLPGGEKI